MFNIGDIRIDRIWSMPNKNTFEIAPIRALLAEEVDSSNLWIDPFANQNKWASITNDLNPEYDAEFPYRRARLFENVQGRFRRRRSLRPPFSPRQVSECYKGVGVNVTQESTRSSFWSNQKKEISRIVKPGGKVISFGWNSGGIGRKYGFEITRILLVPHGGWHNDTICTVEVKTYPEHQRIYSAA